jgi:hypothetical protein
MRYDVLDATGMYRQPEEEALSVRVAVTWFMVSSGEGGGFPRRLSLT